LRARGRQLRASAVRAGCCRWPGRCPSASTTCPGWSGGPAASARGRASGSASARRSAGAPRPGRRPADLAASGGAPARPPSSSRSERRRRPARPRTRGPPSAFGTAAKGFRRGTVRAGRQIGRPTAHRGRGWRLQRCRRPPAAVAVLGAPPAVRFLAGTQRRLTSQTHPAGPPHVAFLLAHSAAPRKTGTGWNNSTCRAGG